MTARGKWRGWPMWYDAPRDRWVYDDGVPVADDPDRACGHCGKADTPEGHDGCLGTLPSVANACCGHGETREAYIQYQDGREVRGEDAIRAFSGLDPKGVDSDEQ